MAYRNEPDDDAVVLEEPGRGGGGDTGPEDPRSSKEIWLRLLYMVIFGILFAIAETVLGLLALLQFGWMLFTGARNARIAAFGDSLALWLAGVTRFQTAVTEDKPFPWAAWPGK